jgi:hypothetical protein
MKKMAHFRGVLQGCRGMVSRLGGKQSGIYASLNSWTNKISVSLVDDNGDKAIISMSEGLKFVLPTGLYVIKNGRLRSIKPKKRENE